MPKSLVHRPTITNLCRHSRVGEKYPLYGLHRPRKILLLEIHSLEIAQHADENFSFTSRGEQLRNLREKRIPIAIHLTQFLRQLLRTESHPTVEWVEHNLSFWALA